MGFHTFDPGKAEKLEEIGRLEYVSVDELLALFDHRGTVADLGSGTGFYTDYVAPYADTLYAVDVQPEMHEYYREKEAPTSVEFVTAEVADLPFKDDSLDGAFSTMTYHEFAGEAALSELARVLSPGARVGTADWSREGECNAGPPRSERYSLDHARETFEESGFVVEYGTERRETFVLSASLELDE